MIGKAYGFNFFNFSNFFNFFSNFFNFFFNFSNFFPPVPILCSFRFAKTLVARGR